MKIKYKITLVIMTVVIAASLPLSLYILSIEAEDRITAIKNQGLGYGRIISGMTLDILIQNAGNIRKARIDAAGMLRMLEQFSASGMIYADTILVSGNPEYNGAIIARVTGNSRLEERFRNRDRISRAETEQLVSGKVFREYYSPDFGESVVETRSVSSIEGIGTYCMARVYYSRDEVMKPIDRMRRIVFFATGFSVVITVLIGLLLGRIVSKPIERLIRGAEVIGSGDMDHTIPVKGRNETARLANTFNHLTRVLKLEIDSLRSKNEELLKVDRLKDDFLANVTHELKTPLYGMMGLAESLVNGAAGCMGDEARKNLSLIISSGQRLSSLVNDIMDYSQLKHEDISLHFSSMDLFSVIRIIISITSPLLENRHVKMINSVKPGLYIVHADENRLQQIMLNLVENAIKFTESGEIEISACDSPDDPGTVVVSIRDTGRGIEKEHREKIFELFEQAGGPIKRYKTGTGIGLSITRQLVELHGGKIWLESEPGEGSVFYFSLKKSEGGTAAIQDERFSFNENMESGILEAPAGDIPGDGIVPGDYGGDNALAGCRIMIVDDEPVNCRILINHLYVEGYTVVPVAAGEEALEMIEKGEVPDLVILDIMLPRMSGYDVCARIREKYSQAELPVLMLTAKNSQNDLITGFRAGANDYLTKPAVKSELLARVNGLLHLKRSVEDQTRLNVLSMEMSIAQKIQKSLLENRMPVTEDVSLALRYHPMYEVGGDFYAISPLSDNRIGIFIADVAGHGIPASFISSMLRVIYNYNSGSASDPAVFLRRINEVIYGLVEEHIITACYTIIDLENRKLIQANAGHWPMIIHKKSNEIIADRGSRLPLGCLDDEDYDNRVYDLGGGGQAGILYGWDY